MFGLPRATEFNKRIPKQKFYENITVTPTLKKLFVEQVKVIYWKNKIATTTINLEAGKYVTEIEIFEIKLNQQMIDERVLYQIDKIIPYHILFLLEYQGKYKAAISYKELSKTNNKEYKVKCYYYTDWLQIDELSIKLNGLNIDIVYENIVRQIAGKQLQSNATESIKESVEKTEKRQKLKKQIDTLQNKIYKEKQLNKQVQLNDELKKLKKELEEIG